MRTDGSFPARRIPLLSFALLACLAVTACEGDDGDDGPPGPPGPPGSPPLSNQLEQGDEPPGVSFQILDLNGGTGSNGKFLPGDTITVHFRARMDDGTDWDLSQLASGRVLVSGPTFNYQRVIAEQTDVLTRSVRKNDGSYTYTFANPIPDTYLAPLNDTPSFGVEDGELTGQPLLSGTYTVGLYGYWEFFIDGESERDVGNAVEDFLLGDGSGALASREVVKQDNCNQCHGELQAHGGQRQLVTLCLMCHTSGSEDRNVASAAGGTPGASIDFRIMIHKIHAGKHLPSVLGVTTNPDGSRKYDAPPEPYQLVGFNNSVIDFSHVGFPVWPNGLVALPRDSGYSSLGSTQQGQENTIRMGPANCLVCHGDPDEGGPLTAPTQGGVAFSQPSRNACGSCHTDVIWGQPYTANLQTMGPQANNANCTLCHGAQGQPLSVKDAHLHPLKNPLFNQGFNVEVTAIGAEGGTGAVQPGQKLEVTFSIKDDEGTTTAPGASDSLSLAISGPTGNYNVLHSSGFPIAKLSGSQPYTTTLPELIQLELVGTSTAALNSFQTARFPHWNVTGALTTVRVVTALGASTNLAVAATAPSNFIDVASAAGFARNDYIVLDPGNAAKEYMRIQWVDGNRLWFAAIGATSYPPGLRQSHSVNAVVQKVTLVSKTASLPTPDYMLDALTGTITELIEFGTGNDVLVDSTVDYVLPAAYPLTFNASPDLGDAWGKWTGKPLVDGTYSLALWGSRTLTLDLHGESNSYRATSSGPTADFLVGSAGTLEPYELISSADNCNACHQEVGFHGWGRKGFQTCVVCHGAAGAEDRPPYVAANAPDTTGALVDFRTMLHKVHMGADLANASTYLLNGFGSGAYPNNFTSHFYDEVEFPRLPGGVRNCAACHGDDNDAWKQPADNTHPTVQLQPYLRWGPVCSACHDGSEAQAHITVQTAPGGVESCGVCHSTGKEWHVEKMHKTY